MVPVAPHCRDREELSNKKNAMSRHRLQLGLLIAATLPCLVAQETPAPAVPVEEIPAPQAVPVEEAPPAPQVVAPGGNVAQAGAIEKAVSRSGMFRVIGGGSGTEATSQRSSVALLLEQTKDNFEALLKNGIAQEDPKQANAPIRLGPRGQAADFKIPIDVILSGKQGDPSPPRSVVYELVVTPESFILRIRVHRARGIDNEQLERAALTMLLYERALRGENPREFNEKDAALFVVRPWLVEGLIEANKWRTNRADRRIYEGVFRQGGGFTAEEIFELPEENYRRLDGASRLSFRALSGALLMALLEQPEGRSAFESFASEAARFSGEMPVLLRKHFPQLNLSGNSLQKWWALKLARMVQPQLTEVLSIRDTELALDEALRFHLKGPDGNMANHSIDEWALIPPLKEQERVEALRPAEDSLTRLSYRCFPSYRPLLIEYQQILRDLASGKKNKALGEQVEELMSQRRTRMERALRARDYMDFMEISQARDLSGEFDDYMRLKEELELRPRPKRHDRITEVLGTMEKVYEPRRGR
jgi:hypothetical protein